MKAYEQSCQKEDLSCQFNVSYGRSWKLRLSLIEEKFNLSFWHNSELKSSIGSSGMGREWGGRRSEVGMTALAAWSKLLLLEGVVFVLSQRCGKFFLAAHMSSPVLHYANAEIWENSCDSYPLLWKIYSHRDVLLEKSPSPWHLFPSMRLSLFPYLSPLCPYARNFLFVLYLWLPSGGFLRSLVCPLPQEWLYSMGSSYTGFSVVLSQLTSFLLQNLLFHILNTVLIWSPCPRKDVEKKTNQWKERIKSLLQQEWPCKLCLFSLEKERVNGRIL